VVINSLVNRAPSQIKKTWFVCFIDMSWEAHIGG